VAFPDLADLETRHDVLVARLNRELALIEQAPFIEVFHGQIRCRKRAGGLAPGVAADSAIFGLVERITIGVFLQ
jgi:hypothetical protein